MDDAYVAKVDVSGSVLWAVRLGGSSEDSGRAVAADSSTGGGYAAGFFRSFAYFGAAGRMSSSGKGGFVAKLDASGAVEWATSLAVSSRLRLAGDVAVDKQHHGALVVGTFAASSTATYFGANANSNNHLMCLPNVASECGFLVYTHPSDGHIVWLAAAMSGYVVRPRGVSSADDGHMYVGGDWIPSTSSTRVDFGSGTFLDANDQSSKGWVVKYDSNGAAVWARTFVASAAYILAVSTTADGGVLVAGSYIGDLAIPDPVGPTPSSLFGVQSSRSGFVVKLGVNGTAEWAKNLRGMQASAFHDEPPALVTLPCSRSSDLLRYKLLHRQPTCTFSTTSRPASWPVPRRTHTHAHTFCSLPYFPCPPTRCQPAPCV